jgi:hypothetical protein
MVLQWETIFSSRSEIRPRSEAWTTLLKGNSTACVIVKIEDYAAQTSADRHGPV